VTDVPPPPPSALPPPPPPNSSKWYSKKVGPLPVWGWIAAALVVLGTIGALTEEPAEDTSADVASDDAEETDDSPVATTTEAPTATTPPPTTSPQTTAPPATSSETSAQRDAKDRAASYLRFSAFSRQGLIEQLEYEGFTTADAAYGVDAQNADWYQQAVLKAMDYLDFMSFSLSGLIDQLEFEGFTTAEATHGAEAAFSTSSSGSGETASQANARESAASYLSFMAFSRSGLIDQLEYEGYSTADATYGVDAQNADWNQQAALKAEEYLDFMSFTRSELIDQLLYEGFTQSEATYGVNQVGL